MESLQEPLKNRIRDCHTAASPHYRIGCSPESKAEWKTCGRSGEDRMELNHFSIQSGHRRRRRGRCSLTAHKYAVQVSETDAAVKTFNSISLVSINAFSTSNSLSGNVSMLRVR